MASVSGLVDQAWALLPEIVWGKRRSELPLLHSVAAHIDPPARANLIADLIERRIAPRLALVLGRKTIDADGYVKLALSDEPQALLTNLDAMIARGVSVESILVDVLAPTARRLGELWEDDACDFVDVTMGLWRLQEVVRELSSRAPALRAAVFGASTALFAPMPGDQHNFGTVIVEDVFRRDGWATDLLLSCDRAELLEAIASQPYDLLGLTVSADADIGNLPSLLRAIRAVSRNPTLCVMLGGRVAVEDPELAIHVGADCSAADAQQALEVVSLLVTTGTCREVSCA